MYIFLLFITIFEKIVAETGIQTHNVNVRGFKTNFRKPGYHLTCYKCTNVGSEEECDKNVVTCMDNALSCLVSTKKFNFSDKILFENISGLSSLLAEMKVEI